MRYAARPPHSRGYRFGLLAADFAAVISQPRRVLGARRGQGRPVAPPQNTDPPWLIEALIAGTHIELTRIELTRIELTLIELTRIELTRIELHDLGPRAALKALAGGRPRKVEFLMLQGALPGS